MPTLQSVIDAVTGATAVVPAGSYTGPLTVRKPMTIAFSQGAVHELGSPAAQSAMVNFLPAASSSLLLNYVGQNLNYPDSMPRGDNDIPHVIRIPDGATNVRVVNPKISNVDAWCVHLDGDSNEVVAPLFQNMIGGVRFYRNSSNCTVRDGTMRNIDGMVRNTSGGNEDTGAMGVTTYENPDAAANRLINMAIYEANAPSYDYQSDGGVIEIWKGGGLIVEDCVLMDANTIVETGTNSSTAIPGGIQMRRCLVGSTSIGQTMTGNNGATVPKYRRGLMLRAIKNSIFENNTFFGLEHWHFVFFQGSSTYGAGSTLNLILRNNKQIANRSRPYSYNQQGSGLSVEGDQVFITSGQALASGAGFTAMTVAEAPSWAGLKSSITVIRDTARANAEFDAALAQANAKKAALLANSGPKYVTTPEPDPVTEIETLRNEVAALEIRLEDAVADLSDHLEVVDVTNQTQTTNINNYRGEVVAMDARVDALEAPKPLHDGTAAKAAIDAIRAKNPNIAKAMDAILAVAVKR